jgi:hypothetical protein
MSSDDTVCDTGLLTPIPDWVVAVSSRPIPVVRALVELAVSRRAGNLGRRFINNRPTGDQY